MEPGSGESGNPVGPAMATSGRVASIGIVTTWSLQKQSTGLLKVAVLSGCSVVPRGSKVE